MEDTDKTTTEGITMEDVQRALDYLGAHNPKPEIPLHQTVSGHDLVATARKFLDLERRLNDLELALEQD